MVSSNVLEQCIADLQQQIKASPKPSEQLLALVNNAKLKLSMLEMNVCYYSVIRP